MNEVEQKLVDIKFILDMYNARADTTENTLEKIQEVLSPETKLNEKQQKYLNLLKHSYEKFGNVHDGIFFSLIDYEKRYGFSYNEFSQVIDSLKVWVMEQEGTE